MSEYRVMRTGDAYQVQRKYYGKWETLGEFDDVKAAKKMVVELREGRLNV